MRNDVLKLLRDQKSTQNKVLYNALLKAYGDTATTKQVYHYQTGYTPGKLEGLIYDVKKHFFITDKEVVLFEEEEDLPLGVIITGDEGKSDAEILQELEAEENLKKKNDLLAALKINDNPDVIEGMKFRNEYPFLDNPNTPDELKALVTDKITAYKQYAGVVASILHAETQEKSEAKLYELGKEALAAYEINQDIKAELDFYRDSNGRILGEHEKLKDLRMKQDVYDMSEADLVKNRANAMKNVSKNNTAGKIQLAEYWKKKQDLIEERLTKEFNKNFNK
ncbi:MAG: hypothetical protein J6O88_05790 [Chryseobacterium sp.]|uniref:hypothetical protein n=1 Tax=Chryseobacterium sp. TaxID=1871047 RepID=UPI001B1A4FEF|nr:hypothetical protein [Chryseobacterium sp.]MBO6184194.1 hypothetical protein [Chryseobacterium sp.]